MKIDTATLSMDAHSSHKEMATKVTRFKGLTNWQKFLNESEMESHLVMDSRRQPQKEPQMEMKLSEESEDVRSVAEVDIEVEEEVNVCTRKNREGRSFAQAEGQLPQNGIDLEHLSAQESSSLIEFSSLGSVETEDGRRLDFSLDMSVRQEVSSAQYCGVQASLIDPLVLAIDDDLPSLASGSSFTFDLDGDGEEERIAALSSGSGFLALDKNGDGIINNGSELFGPLSGQGYAELGNYDADGNMWIDENDPIFDELKIWIGAGSENARLVSLKEAGVGALSLASVGTAFEMKGGNGELLGRISHAGIFLKENGEVKSMAEIDLNRLDSKKSGSLTLSDRMLNLDTEENSPLAATRREEDSLLEAIRDAIFRLESLLLQRNSGNGGAREVVESRQSVAVIRKEVSLKSNFWS